VIPKRTIPPPGFASETILLVIVGGGLVDLSAKSPPKLDLDGDPAKDQQQVIATMTLAWRLGGKTPAPLLHSCPPALLPPCQPAHG